MKPGSREYKRWIQTTSYDVTYSITCDVCHTTIAIKGSSQYLLVMLQGHVKDECMDFIDAMAGRFDE